MKERERKGRTLLVRLGAGAGNAAGDALDEGLGAADALDVDLVALLWDRSRRAASLLWLAAMVRGTSSGALAQQCWDRKTYSALGKVVNAQGSGGGQHGREGKGDGRELHL